MQTIQIPQPDPAQQPATRSGHLAPLGEALGQVLLLLLLARDAAYQHTPLTKALEVAQALQEGSYLAAVPAQAR